jgi:hypothetical protein
MRAALFVLSLGAASAALAEIPAEQRKSGAEFMSAQTRAMQNDDATSRNSERKSIASCKASTSTTSTRTVS